MLIKRLINTRPTRASKSGGNQDPQSHYRASDRALYVRCCSVLSMPAFAGMTLNVEDVMGE